MENIWLWKYFSGKKVPLLETHLQKPLETISIDFPGRVKHDAPISGDWYRCIINELCCANRGQKLISNTFESLDKNKTSVYLTYFCYWNKTDAIYYQKLAWNRRYSLRGQFFIGPYFCYIHNSLSSHLCIHNIHTYACIKIAARAD